MARLLMMKHLAEVSHIESLATSPTVHEVLNLVHWLAANPDA